MKRIVFLLLVTLTVITAAAQKKRAASTSKLPDMTAEEAIAIYDFPLAETLINREITGLKKKRQSTIEQENLLQWLHKAEIKLNAVEKVTFIDSIIVPRNEAVKHIHLSPECGTLCNYTDLFGEVDTLGCTVFKSQMGDQLIYAQPDTSENLKLYMRDVYSDNTMSLPHLLMGISDNEFSQNNPFMLTDGATFYFSAQNAESLGGYDIYMSRYDADEHRFLAPENIGMPFNSPANDYLFAIDEFYNLGWFVTDRNTPEDSVCIYIFIPNETRKVYVPEEVESEMLRRLARISSIRETWRNEDEVHAAQFRFRELKQNRSENITHDFDFVVNDNQVYHRKEDFRTPQGQQLCNLWATNQTDLQGVVEKLAELRKKYHQANQGERERMRSEILAFERKENELRTLIKQQERAMRRYELGL